MADGVQIDWHNICVTAGGGNEPVTILNKVSGYARPGELLAIMGSSGAGKTTLMNVLTQRNLSGLSVTGDISLNGVPASSDNIQKLGAYIQQDDAFVAALTVHEHLMFHARMRLSTKAVKDQRSRVEEVVKIMGLDKCMATVIGTPGLTKTLSGGEMKRLSIATEILNNPPLIFADEPTSGLDSYLALTVIKCLDELAASGTTVLCTIHQPNSDIFARFKSLMLVAKGRCAYLGPSDEAHSFFNSLGYPCKEHYNPADHFINELSMVEGKDEYCKEKIDNICNKHETGNTMKNLRSNSFSGSECFSPISESENSTKGFKNALVSKKLKEYDDNHIKFFPSLWWLLGRALISQYRDRATSGIIVAQNIFVSLMAGLIYLRIPWNPNIAPYTNIDLMNLNGGMFLIVCATSFPHMFGVVLTFPKLKKIFAREYHSGLYTVASAYMATCLAGIPLLVVMPFVFLGIDYCMFGLFPLWSVFFNQYLTVMLIAMVASGYGFVISSIAPSLEAANALAAPMMIPFMIFGGFFIRTLSTPYYFIWIKYLSWFYYGFNNLIINQWKHGGYCAPTTEVIVQDDGCMASNLTDCSCLIDTVKHYRQDNNPGAITVKHEYVDPSEIFDMLGFNVDDYWPNIGCMVGLAIGYRLIGYLIICFKFRSSNR